MKLVPCARFSAHLFSRSQGGNRLLLSPSALTGTRLELRLLLRRVPLLISDSQLPEHSPYSLNVAQSRSIFQVPDRDVDAGSVLLERLDHENLRILRTACS